jgi:hypothetical protein
MVPEGHLACQLFLVFALFGHFICRTRPSSRSYPESWQQNQYPS